MNDLKANGVLVLDIDGNKVELTEEDLLIETAQTEGCLLYTSKGYKYYPDSGKTIYTTRFTNKSKSTITKVKLKFTMTINEEMTRTKTFKVNIKPGKTKTMGLNYYGIADIMFVIKQSIYGYIKINKVVMTTMMQQV